METQIINPLDLPDLGEEYVPLRTRFRKGDENDFWFCNLMHFPKPIAPLAIGMLANDMDISFTLPCQLYYFPAKGLESRFRMGRFYQTTTNVTPDELKARWPRFEEMSRFYITHWDKLVSEGYDECKRYCEELKKYDLKELSLYPELAYLLEKGLWYRERMWLVHMEFLWLAYAIYMAVFDQTLSEIFPKMGEHEKMKLIQGYDTSLYSRVDEMWRLSNLAIDLGLTDTFKKAPIDELQARLEKTAAGRSWLKELSDFLSEWGHLFAAHHEVHLPTWFEDPRECLLQIKGYVAKGKYDPGKEREKLAKEREQFFQELLKKVPGEQRERLEMAVRTFQRIYPYLEDHPRYMEQEIHARVRYIIVEIGRRFVEAEAMDEPNDVFFLTLDELRNSIRDVYLALLGRGYISWDPHSTISRRKEIFRKQAEWKPTPIVGTPKEITEPMMLKLWGYGLEQYKAGLKEVGIVDRLTGLAAAPGIAEGRAKVIMGPDEFGAVEAGDILVCPATAPGWAPLFPMIIAVVTNEGGSMSHAAIIAREYGIPAVVATGAATSKIKTGERIRVDGTSGVVTILR